MDSTFKQPSEKFFITVSFSKVLATGEQIDINNSSVVAVDLETGQDATSEIIEAGTLQVTGANNEQLSARVKGGIDKHDYKITFVAGTTDGNTFEKDIKLRVSEE